MLERIQLDSEVRGSEAASSFELLKMEQASRSPQSVGRKAGDLMGSAVVDEMSAREKLVMTDAGLSVGLVEKWMSSV